MTAVLRHLNGRTPATGRGDRGQVLTLAALSWIPLLLTHRGMVAADTKPYLTLDPWGLLRDATSMWQPDFAMGTVTHQNIGFLWPIGPFFAVGDLLALPDWFVQRLWLGSILFAAGLGLRWFLRTLGWRGASVLVASLAYMLSPYLLDYVARISVILLPWAGLPWMLALTVRSLRTGGWRHPALFALTTLTIGGVNATSLLLVGLGPVLWIAWSVLEGSVPWRRALAVATRIGLLVAGTSLWWIAGLRTQAAHGLPTLRLTETYEVIAEAATAPELFRGLGYWFFYGQDKLGPWIEPAHAYTRWALPLSYALPLLGLLAAAVTRFRHRGHLLLLFGIGMLTAIAAHPFDAPSPLGRVFKAWTETDAGLAMRSTPRALPLVVLATAVFLGAAAAALASRMPERRRSIAVVLCLAIIANLSPLWTGQLLGDNLERPEEVPDHWLQVAGSLESPAPHQTRVLEIPGSDFAAHRWGNAVDPILPGLTNRGHVARELVPLGTPASAALVVALDTEVQEGRLDTGALAPLARLMGVGEVVFRGDLQYERYRTPRPPDLWAELLEAPGLEEPRQFGTGLPNLPFRERPLVDEHTLDRPLEAAVPPYTAVFAVQDAQSILRTADPTRPIVLSGDAEGLVAAAGEGFLEPGRPVFFSASLTESPEVVNQAGALLLITDTNRKRGQRWGTIRETQGYTERADEVPLADDPTDQRLAVLPDIPGSRTVAVQHGVRASATAYGNPVTLVPDSRPFHAVDGDENTAWKVAAFSDARGERLLLEYDEAIPVSGLDLQQFWAAGQNRHITEVRIRTDHATVEATLDERSLPPGRQRIDLPSGTTDHLEVEILATSDAGRRWFFGASSVGFTEVGQSPVAPDETIALPSDLGALIDGDRGQELAVLLTRLRSDPLDPVRNDGETHLDRTFTLPFGRNFDLEGEVRLSAVAPEQLVDDLLGRDPGIVAHGSTRLSGSLRSGGDAALDGDPATAWIPAFAPQEGQVLTVRFAETIAVGDLQVLARRADHHSTPTRIALYADDQHVATSGVVALDEDAVAFDLPVDRQATLLEFVVEAIDPVVTLDWYSSHPVVLPVAISEVLGLPAVQAAPMVDGACREDLLEVDGAAVSVRVEGATADALARKPLGLSLCDGPLDLGPGEHRLRTADGRYTGIDVDQLLLRDLVPYSGVAPTPPTVTYTDWDKTARDLVVASEGEPFWLVLGESHTDGWRLSSPDLEVEAAPVLVDGYANGWLVDPDGAMGDVRLRLAWTPQRLVTAGLLLSLLAALACLVLARRGRRDEAGPAEAIVSLVDPRGTLAAMGTRGSVTTGLLVTAGAWLNLPAWPVAAPLLGLLTGLVLAGRLWRRLLPLLATASMALAALLIVVDQVRYRYPRDFIWPAFFDRYHVLGVLAVLFVLAEAIRTLLARRHVRSKSG